MKNVPFFFNNEIVKDEYLKWLPAIKFLFTESSLTTSVYSRLFSYPVFHSVHSLSRARLHIVTVIVEFR